MEDELQDQITTIIQTYSMTGNWHNGRDQYILWQIVQLCSEYGLTTYTDIMSIVRNHILTSLQTLPNVHIYQQTPGNRPLFQVAENAARNIYRRFH